MNSIANKLKVVTVHHLNVLKTINSVTNIKEKDEFDENPKKLTVTYRKERLNLGLVLKFGY